MRRTLGRWQPMHDKHLAGLHQNSETYHISNNQYNIKKGIQSNMFLRPSVYEHNTVYNIKTFIYRPLAINVTLFSLYDR